MYVEYVIYHPVDSNAISILDRINGDTWFNFNFLEHGTSRLNQQPESNFKHSMHTRPDGDLSLVHGSELGESDFMESQEF